MDQAVTGWIRRCSVSSEKIKELSQHVSQLRDLLEDRQEEVSRLSDWFRYIENRIGKLPYSKYFQLVRDSINQALEGKYPKES
jgi:predicted nuclease with TOPRIM domain